MPRLKRPVIENTNPNPVTKFLQWKSNDKCFEYYDKEKKDKVKVELPLKVLFMEHYHTVKGWSDKAQSGIWSNEVYSTMKEELEVKNSEGTIVKGIYSQNKEFIKNAGGVYHRSIYCMLPNGELINLQLKGASVGGINKESSLTEEYVCGWNTFHSGDKKRNIKGKRHLLDNQWIEINDIKEGKKGAVKYCIPFFEVGKNITTKENELANECASKLQNYMDVYFGRNEENKEVVEETTQPEPVLAGSLDDLDF